jgi:hypothetical protein
MFESLGGKVNDMGYIIALVFLITNLIGTFFGNKSKIRVIFILVSLWILFGWNTFNPDYYNYLSWYNDVQYSSGLFTQGKDFGYNLLMKVTQLIGLEYSGFLIVVSIIGLLLIHSTIKRYAMSDSYVYLLYFIYPFLLDVVQVRNFIMMSILIYSVRFLL